MDVKTVEGVIMERINPYKLLMNCLVDKYSDALNIYNELVRRDKKDILYALITLLVNSSSCRCRISDLLTFARSIARQLGRAGGLLENLFAYVETVAQPQETRVLKQHLLASMLSTVSTIRSKER